MSAQVPHALHGERLMERLAGLLGLVGGGEAQG